MKKRLLEYSKYWFLGAAVISVIFATIYVVAQQNLRWAGNDPQIQLAEDTASALSKGTQFSESIPNIDIEKSLSPFVIVFDPTKKPILSTAYLGKKIPSPPSGVFDYAKNIGENRVTWQPQDGVRVATVVTYYENASSSGYVLAGRSLREVESRVSKLGGLVLFGWLVSLLVLFLAISFAAYKKIKK